jgi:hypothetical protein
MHHRLDRLDARVPPDVAPCPECGGTEPPDTFPICFGKYAPCGTCNNLVTPPVEELFRRPGATP